MTVERGKRSGVVFGWVVAPVIALLVGPGGALAATPANPEVGEAELVVSAVRGHLGEITRELAIKDDVYSEEVIETDDDAATRIVFLDGSELSMGPSSRMVLDRYVYDPNAGTGEMVMQMVTGVFEFASGEIPSANYDLGTPFGNLAIRGTRCILSIVAGARLVLQCSELQEVSMAGRTLTSASDCLVVPLPGTGEAAMVEGDECARELAPAQAMLAMLGRLQVEPAAAPGLQEVRQGPGSEKNDPPGFAGPGVSPR